MRIDFVARAQQQVKPPAACSPSGGKRRLEMRGRKRHDGGHHLSPRLPPWRPSSVVLGLDRGIRAAQPASSRTDHPAGESPSGFRSWWRGTDANDLLDVSLVQNLGQGLSESFARTSAEPVSMDRRSLPFGRVNGPQQRVDRSTFYWAWMDPAVVWTAPTLSGSSWPEYREDAR